MKNENTCPAFINLTLSTIKHAVVFLALAWCILPGCKSGDDTPVPDPAYPTTPGKYELSIDMDTTTRWFTVVIPPEYDPAETRPLVLAFHPGNANMAEFYNALIQFLEYATAEKWIVVLPNGRNTTDNRTGECLWNAVHCCGLAYNQNVDDVGFVRKLVEKLQTEYKIDEKRIYALGRSNGGMLVHRLGAEMWDVFAAIAPFSATVGGTHDENSPLEIVDPSHPLPILMMHGLNDPVVKFFGGIGGDGVRTDLPFHDTALLWVENNGCDQMAADTTFIDTEKGKSWVVDFSNCTDNAQVVAITVENSGHQLPRISNSGFDGSKAMFDFFKLHAKN